MYNINLLDLLLVGIPEVMIAILIGLYVVTGNWKYNKMKFKILSATIFILSGLYIIRAYSPSVNFIVAFSIALYFCVFKINFDLNIRKSLIASFLVLLFILFSEIITFPFMDYMSQSNDYFSNRLQVTIATRLLQLATLVAIVKYRFWIGRLDILDLSWSKLNKEHKCIAIAIVLLLGSCIIFVSNYEDLFFKVNELGNSVNLNINLNMTMYIVQNIVFVSLVFYILVRTNKFVMYEEYLKRHDREIFVDLLEDASKEEIREYIEIAEIFYNELENFEGGDNNEE